MNRADMPEFIQINTKMKNKIALLIITLFVLICQAQEKSKTLTLRLERIDPVTNKSQVETEKVPIAKVGIIVMDMWDAHWCKSWTAREADMIPKMNRFLAEARRKGVQVIFSPSSVAAFYKDYPQRKAVFYMPVSREYEYPSVDDLLNLDEKKQLDYNLYSKRYFAGTIYEARDSSGYLYKGFPPLPPFSSTGGCECSDRNCTEADVWHRQNKDLVIGANDLIVEGNNKSEFLNVCRATGLTHLLYIGGAGNMCLTSSRETSTINMSNRGLKCVYLEDLMISISGNGYNPDTKMVDPSFTPQTGDSLVLIHLKKYIAPSAKTYEVFPDLK